MVIFMKNTQCYYYIIVLIVPILIVFFCQGRKKMGYDHKTRKSFSLTPWPLQSKLNLKPHPITLSGMNLRTYLLQLVFPKFPSFIFTIVAWHVLVLEMVPTQAVVMFTVYARMFFVKYFCLYFPPSLLYFFPSRLYFPPPRLCISPNKNFDNLSRSLRSLGDFSHESESFHRFF